MQIDNTPANRLAIYFFYDQSGIVDDYVTYFLDDLSKNVGTIISVSNGELPAESRAKLSKYGEVFERENSGLDVWAYKETIEKVGWENIRKYDEVILLNNTIMGPIYPFSETFEKMSTLDLDFWGLTKWHESPDPLRKTSDDGIVKEHIQSHFIVCRKSLLVSSEFKEYWDTMPEICSYYDSVKHHEVKFTKYFESAGFNWDVSANTDGMTDYLSGHIFMCPKKMIEELRCPIFKKRSFFQDDTAIYTNEGTGEQVVELFEYLQSSTNYDTDFIWSPVLRRTDQFDLFKNMALTHILPKEYVINSDPDEPRVALLMHLYFPELFVHALQYAKSMPSYSDVYITTQTEEKKREIEKVFQDLECAKLEVRVIENRGRDVSALMVGLRDVVQNYDLICFAHDKKVEQLAPSAIGSSFGYKCFQNTLGSKEYVANIIDTFQSHPRIGILSPPEPNHSIYYFVLGNEWGTDEKNVQPTLDLMKKLGVEVSVGDKNHPPIAPFGSVFWFRPKAMKKLFDYNWQYSDFPEEPLSVDGTISHAIERVYPYIAQDAGYYPGICMTDKFAAIEYGNLKYYLRTNNVKFDKVIAMKKSASFISKSEVLDDMIRVYNNHQKRAIVRISRIISRIALSAKRRVLSK